ncbi:MAG TPA: bifunctional UDP-N-acetylglucosamine diphosphorylase/glucosamine-1-phosphate N-acetyltransferase GlmU [Bryobacteraceae bacterium]|nr:bifunctional UDP-N-acetylglucosamine diphosphorylase/glucosamine-1-phosphate N-acetyltransferase GlmU [Bryobacteraceae bacterium]
MDTPITVAILAAGLGTRMKSRHAKVLHEAGGRPLIQHVVRTALALAPAERICVIVGHQAEKVKAAVTTPGVRFVHQAEQKGTGHALMVGREVMQNLPGLLVILYGDCPLISAETLRRLVDVQQRSGAAGTLISAEMPDPTGYGRVLRDDAGAVRGVVEQKAATPPQLAVREANMGIYCYRADLFWRHLGEIRPENPAGEYYLTDMVEILLRAGHTMEAMLVGDAREALGINNRVELAEVDRLLRERKARQLMLDGVTIRQPETVTIDVDAQIGMDTVVEPFAQILGKTTIGENCRIGACSIVRDSQLADDVELGPFTIVGTSRLERGAHAGPFSRLRMDNDVAEGAHVGNFVELKKTRLGPGSKAMHLAYLGDSKIGAKVNVGAGTITCNYDGRSKHATHIGDGAFVGSNSTLVAPLEIGDGAYLAAGSVITEDVPGGALAVGRSRQVIKEGWAKKRAERKQGMGDRG